MTVDKMREHLQAFFGDTSRSRDDTREGLEELKDEIENMLSALDED